jgi:hypothetical protein
LLRPSNSKTLLRIGLWNDMKMNMRYFLEEIGSLQYLVIFKMTFYSYLMSHTAVVLGKKKKLGSIYASFRLFTHFIFFFHTHTETMKIFPPFFLLPPLASFFFYLSHLSFLSSYLQQVVLTSIQTTGNGYLLGQRKHIGKNIIRDLMEELSMVYCDDG